MLKNIIRKSSQTISTTNQKLHTYEIFGNNKTRNQIKFKFQNFHGAKNENFDLFYKRISSRYFREGKMKFHIFSCCLAMP